VHVLVGGRRSTEQYKVGQGQYKRNQTWKTLTMAQAYRQSRPPAGGW
jgi:hypothetical protein